MRRQPRRDDAAGQIRRRIIAPPPSNFAEPPARRALPLDAHLPRSGHAELGGRGIAARHARGHAPAQSARHHHARHRHVRGRAHGADVDQRAAARPKLDRERVPARCGACRSATRRTIVEVACAAPSGRPIRRRGDFPIGAGLRAYQARPAGCSERRDDHGHQPATRRGEDRVLRAGTGSCCRPSRRSRIQKKITGVTISTCRSDDTIPPSTGVASGFITSAPTRVLHMIGSRPATTVETVMTFGRSRSSAPSMTASRSAARVSAPPSASPLPLDRLLEVDHHHDAGLHGGAEQRDEADPDRDGEVVAEQPEQVDAAGQRERDGQQHVRRFERRVIGEVQQDEDDQQDDRQHDLQPLPRALLVLPPAAPRRRSSRRQRDRARRRPRAPPRRTRRRRGPARSAARSPAAGRSRRRSSRGRAPARCARPAPSGTCAPHGAATSTLRQRLRIRAGLRRIAHAHRETARVPRCVRRQHASRRWRSRSPPARRRRRGRSGPPRRDRRRCSGTGRSVTCSG